MLILYCFFNRLLLSIFGVLRVHGLTVGFFLMICSCRLIHRHIEPFHPAKIPRLRTAPNIIFANIDKTYRIFYPPQLKTVNQGFDAEEAPVFSFFAKIVGNTENFDNFTFGNHDGNYCFYTC